VLNPLVSFWPIADFTALLTGRPLWARQQTRQLELSTSVMGYEPTLRSCLIVFVANHL